MDQPPQGNAFSFADQLDVRIHRRLKLVGEGPAQFFRDACYFMSLDAPPPTVTHIVGHLLRDTESAIRAVLLPIDWTPPEEGKHRKEILASLDALDIDSDHPVAVEWLDLPRKESRYRLHARAHRRHLGVARPLDDDFRVFWHLIRELLDHLLDRYEARYAAYEKRLLDLVAVEHPDKGHIAILRQSAPNSDRALGQFYAALTNPKWLPLLRKHGIFDGPYEGEVDPESGDRRCPAWPPSACLPNMAGHSDETANRVVEIALGLKKTGNMWVQNDAVKAVIEIENASIAARLVPCICEWLEKPHFYITHPAEELAVRLAAARQEDAALELARALLHVEIPEELRGEGLRLGRQPASRLEGTDYIRVAERLTADLSPHAPLRTLVLLCDLLEVAAEVAYGRPPSGDRRDNSHYWRRAIENHEQNGLARLADGLVYGARSVLELLATEDSTRVPELIESLEARPWRIFDRLALHALRLFPTHAGHLIAERLMDPDLFDDTDAWHEYALLLRDGFMLLSDDQRAALVERARHTYSADAVLEEGDDPETGRPYTTRKAEHIADYRALRRLAPARQHVPASLQARFVEVEAESGPVEHPEFRSYITSSSGWPTPVTADELREMTDAQIIEALRTPLARVSHRSPAPQGLARQLQTCVEEDPARFAELAADFVEMDPTYVRGLVLGLSDAVTNENHFPWEPVLSLCRWTLDQPRKLSNRTWPDGDQDHGWVQTWRWIGDLLCKALQKHDDGIPYSCRDAVIEVIGVLVRDPDPSPDEQGEDDGALSHAMDALNSVRGSALHALIHYALWLNGHMVRELELPEDATVGFARMPEVVTILDERLDKDESLAIRSVYGQWLPWLRLLDAEWTTANLPRILPPGEDEHPLWEVAWHTYIGWCRAYDEMLEFLEGEYRRALTRLDADAPESPGREHPDVRLAEHLHMFYLRGKLEIGESSGLLSEFYAAAAPWLRARALERMGWWMQDDDPPSQVAVGRAIDLWEWRAAQATENRELEELAAFNAWLPASVFDAEWALKHMRSTLRLGAPIDHAWIITRDLAGHAAEQPVLAFECLELVLERMEDAPHLHLSDSDVQQVISSALDCSDQGTRRRAKELANRLVARGWANFTELAQHDSDPQ